MTADTRFVHGYSGMFDKQGVLARGIDRGLPGKGLEAKQQGTDLQPGFAFNASFMQV